MADTTAAALLLVGNDRTVFGWMAYRPETITWDLARYWGAQGVGFSGFALDPTGRYLIQAPQLVWVDADETQWGAKVGTFGHGTSSPDLGAKKCLRSTGTGPFAATFNTARVDEEGVFLSLYIGAGTSPTFYVAFNASLRLALEPGQPIRLQSYSNGAWTDLQTASALGECEAYLSSAGRRLTVDVCPLTDPSWEAGLPYSRTTSKQPPSEVSITINGGDAVLTIPADSLPGGSVQITGQNRQWGCAYALKRHALSPTGSLPPQATARLFRTTPQFRYVGYVPYTTTVSGSINILDSNVASATLSVSATADATGFALSTVALSLLDADFPALQVAPASTPSFSEYEPTFAQCTRQYNPSNGTVRSTATCEFANNNGEFAPGTTVHQSVRAAQLLMGYLEDPLGLAAQITGYTALGGQGGQTWGWEEGQNAFRVTVQDRGRKGDPDQTPCGKLPAFDNQPHYYAMRMLLNREGVTDGWLDFPLMDRDDADPTVYSLPTGTNARPSLLFHPSMPTGLAREQIRKLSAAIGEDGTPYPMVMGFNALGVFEYFPLPQGVIAGFLDSTQTLSQLGVTPYATYSAIPGFDGGGLPLLNEILDSGLRTYSDLTNVRTPCVAEGLDPRTGNAVLAWAFNELLGGGEYADPDAPGYIGTDVDLIEISRYISSLAYAEYLATIFSRQLSWPSVGIDLRLYLQPRLGPLTIIQAIDPVTQGTDAAVAYYTTLVDSFYDNRQGQRHAETRTSARLLGQAG